VLTTAVIGLGAIGGRIAHRLAERGVPLVVFDVRADAGDDVVAGHARRSTSCADAAADADVVIIAVVDDAQALDVMSGADGVLASARPGTVVVLHSTVHLRTVRELASMAEAHGVHLLDVGVSTFGGHQGGTLALMAGGDPAHVDTARPVLEHYADPLDYLGPLGSGMAVKLVRNLLGYALMAAAYEALKMAEHVGVELDVFRRVLTESDVVGQFHRILSLPTTDPLTESQTAADFYRAFTDARGEKLVETIEHALAIMEKDLDDGLAFAEEAHVELTLAPAVRTLLRPVMLLPPLD
jgi:3-hydroxyisobutyrate dehydrogenase-like beta-hydroxyacid dehydrogenase